MATGPRKPFIVGVSWRKLQNQHDDSEDVENSPMTRSRQRESSRTLQRFPFGDRKSVINRTLRRVKSVRDAFGSFRQKIKVSTRQRKRLINASPFTTPKSKAGSRASTPNSAVRCTITPNSAVRRSARLAKKNQNVLMYSPFCIDTPSKTPSKIRMGIHEPKRFNFSSPGQLRRDLDLVSSGIQALSNTGDNFTESINRQHTASPRCGIRTTPRATKRRTSIFV